MVESNHGQQFVLRYTTHLMDTYTMSCKTEPASDFDIIDRILEGNQEWFATLIKRHNASLYKAGRAYKYNHADTEDLMQDTFIEAYINLAKFEKRSSFKTWLLRIMINHCHKRRQKRSYTDEVAREIHEYDSPLFANTRNDTHHMILNHELNDIISRALLEVSEDYRMVFTLREIAGLNVKETAEVLRITETNVKVRLNRAKSMLRQKVGQSYRPEDIFEFNLVYCDAMVNRVMHQLRRLKVEAV